MIRVKEEGSLILMSADFGPEFGMLSLQFDKECEGHNPGCPCQQAVTLRMINPRAMTELNVSSLMFITQNKLQGIDISESPFTNSQFDDFIVAFEEFCNLYRKYRK